MTDHHNTIFFTGITGAAGSWLAAEALKRSAHLLALVRGADLPRARERVERALETAGARDLAGAVSIVPGDLCQPALGGAARDARLRGTKLVIHCAARVEFTETADNLLQRSNVEGTREILALTERLGAGLVYVGTAYVAGRARLSYEDELPAAPEFNNAYERSKHEAESLVREWARRTGRPVIILRPGILLGDSVRGAATRFNTVYDFMRAFERLAPALGRGEIRVEGEAEVTKNLVPLDTFAQAAWHIIERGEPGCYHLTNPAPPSLAELRDIFARLFGVGRIRLVAPTEFDACPPSMPERLYQRAVTIYRPYMHQEPVFDRTNTDAALAGSGIELPPLDYDYFNRLLGYARSVNWAADVDTPTLPSAGNETPTPAKTRSVERYFTEFLREKIGKQLLPELRKLSASVGITVENTKTDEARAWVLEIRDGALTSVSHNGLVPQCAYRLNEATFGQIVSGRLEPQRAFFERRVDLEGDMETGLRLAFILTAFFRQYSYDLDEG